MTAKIEAQTLRDNAIVDEAAVILKVTVDATLNTSQKIRTLAAMGVKRGTIAELLGKRYQHVRNVLETNLTSKK